VHSRLLVQRIEPFRAACFQFFVDDRWNELGEFAGSAIHSGFGDRPMPVGSVFRIITKICPTTGPVVPNPTLGTAGPVFPAMYPVSQNTKSAFLTSSFLKGKLMARTSQHLHRLSRVALITLVGGITFPFLGSSALAQDNEFKRFDATSIFQELDVQSSSGQVQLVQSWWDEHVTNAMRSVQPLETDIHTLLYLAVQHSNNIKIAKRDPLIRETAIQEADSSFDWVRYLNTAWNDTSQPIGNTLTAGGTATQFNDNVFTGTGGFRRLTRYGGLLDISQQFGWQDNNSIFLTPDQQATSQFTVSYTHPLLRGRGAAYNASLVFLAEVDAEVAENEFLATLQDELLEITRSYWALYQERAVLAHQMRLFLKTRKVYQTLKARQGVDTKRTQLIVASSALENRRADLIRARTAVTNAETRLRGLINAPELANTDVSEVIPAEMPSVQLYSTDLQTEIETAVQNRPEVMAAIRQVKAGSTRLGVAEHELLPALNLVTQGFLNGLRGDSDFGGSFVDQFSDGAPSYSIGLQYELPVGNRLARARLCRRKHELAQLEDQYARALTAVQTEVDIAVRELNTSYMEIGAKSRALAAAEAEAETIEQRWLRMVDGNGSAGLNLESLIAAQERVTENEREYVNSVLTYNLAMINLKRSNGTLLGSQNVNVSKTCSNGECKSIEITKGNPNGDVASYYPTAHTMQPVEVAPSQGVEFQNLPVDPSQFQQLPPVNDGIAPVEGTFQQAPPVAPQGVIHGAQANPNPYDYFRR
jgi:outer membrane protein TolC